MLMNTPKETSLRTNSTIDNDTLRIDIWVYQLGWAVKKWKPFAHLKYTFLDLLNVQISSSHLTSWQLRGLRASTSSRSTNEGCFPDPCMDSSREDNIGSVAKINSLRVSSKGSTISWEDMKMNILRPMLKKVLT
jgi:hypothetical protein